MLILLTNFLTFGVAFVLGGGVAFFMMKTEDESVREVTISFVGGPQDGLRAVRHWPPDRDYLFPTVSGHLAKYKLIECGMFDGIAAYQGTYKLALDKKKPTKRQK